MKNTLDSLLLERSTFEVIRRLLSEASLQESCNLQKTQLAKLHIQSSSQDTVLEHILQSDSRRAK